MRNFKLIIMSLVILTLTACSDMTSQLYVKNVSLSKEEDIFKLSVVYYDFSQQEEQYQKKEYTSEDIYKIGIKAMNDNNYNFRLCENIFLYPEIFLSDIDKAVYVINSLKISPNANVVCYIGQETDKDMSFGDISQNPLHNISLNENHVSGFFPVIVGQGDNVGTILVSEGSSVKFLDKSHQTVLSMLTNSVKNTEYVFRDEQMWANLERICTRFYVEKDILNVCIDASLKDYKGIQNSIQSKDLFINLLKTDVSNKVYNIYNDMQVSRMSGVHWYCRQQGTECTDVNIQVNIK